uniref:PPM-type phosphatase domain-containing protein n=1 Tax=Zooxanthella nutricula TaxID=1333877 RepID=A0A7S2KFB2_9DINO|mmetsp:Transcript_47342/g.143981  ORF Transcript_47342/g.143981 Transcript_47342/m.143981 type:complete len:452 (+) Transcript_47342:68-1423(+)
MGQANSAESASNCFCGNDSAFDVDQEVVDRVRLAREFAQRSEEDAVKYVSQGSNNDRISPTVIYEDQRRRRLSVSAQGGVAPTAVVIDALADDSPISAQGLTGVFNKQNLGSKRAVSLCSKTETAGGRRASFKEKDGEVTCPPGQDDETSVQWLSELGLAWACKKGMKPDSPNQDSFSILAVEDTFILIGVYDGHGPRGHDVSQFARVNMVRNFLAHPARLADPEAALLAAFSECQEQIIRSLPRTTCGDSGTTCTMAYLDLAKKRLTVAHVGDARAAFCKQRRAGGRCETEDLTIDHKPDLEVERRRIESANPPGRVIFDGYVNYRVFAQNGMYPGLNMSRALGDVIAHEQAGLTAVPDVRTVDLGQAFEGGMYSEVLLVVCTDGVWEFIESQQVAEMALEAVSIGGPNASVNRLATEAWDQWMTDSHGEVCDDITAVCLRLPVQQSPGK